MKIAFVNTFQDGESRGAEVFVDQISKRLSDKYEVVEFFGGKTPGVRLPFLWRLFIDPHGLQSLFYTLKIFPRLVDERPDITVALNSGWQVIILRIVTRLMGKKLVVVGQSGIGWDDRVNIWCMPDTFVSLTPKSSDWAKEVNPHVERVVIPNGVDTNMFKKNVAKYDHGLEGGVVLSVGALIDEKGHGKVIDAVSLLKDASLLIVGKGPLKSKLKRLGNEKLKKRFKIISIDHDKMPEVFKSADVFVYPTSERESFGIVLVEAMAMELPIVIGNDEIRKQIVGKDAIVVDINSANKFADGIETAIKKGSIKYKMDKYDWDNIAGLYSNLFKELNNEN